MSARKKSNVIDLAAARARRAEVAAREPDETPSEFFYTPLYEDPRLLMDLRTAADIPCSDLNCRACQP